MQSLKRGASLLDAVIGLCLISILFGLLRSSGYKPSSNPQHTPRPDRCIAGVIIGELEITECSVSGLRL